MSEMPCLRGRSWCFAGSAGSAWRSGAAGGSAIAGAPVWSVEDNRLFEIECEVEDEGVAYRFTFEVAAPDEDAATDRAIEMLDRARVTGAWRKRA